MTAQDTVDWILGFRNRIPSGAENARRAHQALEALAAARDEEERERLVDEALGCLVSMGLLPNLQGKACGAHDVRVGEQVEATNFDSILIGSDWTTPSERRRGEQRGAQAAALPPASGPAMITRTPHISISATRPIQVGLSFGVTVHVDTEALEEGEQGAPLHLPDGVLTLGVTLTTSGHFEIEGSDKGELVVRGDVERSTDASFTVRCKGAASGRPGIAASFTYGWRPVGGVWRELEVAGVSSPAPGETVAPTAPALAVDQEARPPDLLVTITRAPDGDELHYDLTVATPHLAAYERGVTVRWNLPARTQDMVAGMMKPFTTSAPGGRKAALIGAGRRLFGATPEDFQKAFWGLVDDNKPLESIFVVTTEPFIPWELMVPYRGSAQREALGAEFSVGRWVQPALVSPEQLLPITDSYVIAPRYRGSKKLSFSAHEAQFVMSSFNGTPIDPALLQEIDAKLGADSRSLLHLICHGADGPDGQTLDLDRDEVLHEVMLSGFDGVRKAIATGRPLVFINACQVGRITPALTGTGGFAAAFTELGARCVIAPIWSVKDSVAQQVARSFYTRARAEPKTPYATILRDIRKLAYEGANPEDSYAAYCFYGDPRAAQER